MGSSCFDLFPNDSQSSTLNQVMSFQTLELSLWMKSYSVTIRMKAIERYFPVVLFLMLFKVVLAFKSVAEILNCESY